MIVVRTSVANSARRMSRDTTVKTLEEATREIDRVCDELMHYGYYERDPGSGVFVHTETGDIASVTVTRA